MPFPGRNTVAAWFVLREDPWHLPELYATEAEATAAAERFGPEYRAQYGEGWVGSDDLIFSDPPG